MTNNVLSIAGFDPSAGAGVLADVKAVETNGAYCFGVVSALTYQNESEFDAIEWIDEAKILRQIETLLRKHKFSVLKIGLIQNLNILFNIIEYIKQAIPNIKIIWDPILKASAGYEFHSTINRKLFDNIIESIFLITPNIPESEILFNTIIPTELQKILDRKSCNILLKSGHATGNEATDLLISANEIFEINAKRIADAQKHGTGCVLSASIAAYMAVGYDIVTSTKRAKVYMNNYLISTDGLLGIHKSIKY
jgi:hydroxymethylpyrimidine/phosphomethylpyrimidine kinase